MVNKRSSSKTYLLARLQFFRNLFERLWNGPETDIEFETDQKNLSKQAHIGAYVAERERKHVLNMNCWCNPRIDYVNPLTGIAVVIHNRDDI